MTYKDPDKQREANREASQRRRDRYKGMTHNVTERMYEAHKKREGMTVKNERSNVIPSSEARVIPKCAIPNGDTDISTVKALHQLISKRDEGVITQSVTGQGVTVALHQHPDDAVKTERTGINLAAIGLAEAPNDIGGTKLIVKPKRGKDIKVFADLPPDVQQTIDSLSMVDGKICQRVKANRTAIAISYEHVFPD